MKLLGCQALPGGIEARHSLNCFECSVHPWPERPVTVYPDVSRWPLGMLLCLLESIEHEGGKETMAGNQIFHSFCSSLHLMFCLYLCTTLSSPLDQLTGPRACVKNRYPDLACGYPTAPCTHALHPHSLHRLLSAPPVLPLQSHQYRKSRAFASCTTH